MSAGNGTGADGIDSAGWITAEQLAKALSGRAKRKGREWRTVCPTHADDEPSLDITERSGKLLLHCRAGCPQTEVIKACRARGLWPDSKSKAKPVRPNGASAEIEQWEPIVPPPEDAPKPSNGQLRCDTLHEYRDADGRLMFFVRRHEARNGQAKQFRPLTYGALNGKLGWHSKAPGKPLPLYNLDRLGHTSSATVLLCEGEKAADAAQRLFPDMVAVSWMGGAGKADLADLTPLTGHEVIIWPDADAPGRTAAAVLAEKLCVARVVDTTELPNGFDAADLEHEDADPREWLERQLTKSDARSEALKSIALITEGAVAEEFAAEHRDELRYCHTTRAWFVWDGARWKREETNLAYSWAYQISKALAANTKSAKTIITAGRAAFSSGVERIAQADRAFAVTNRLWDQDLYLLGTPGGTVDLRTGALRSADQADYITKQTAIAPSDKPDCPLWLAFLHEVTQGDQGLVDFYQRWFGYCLTGDTREESLLFAWGSGGNGKGVLMHTVAKILGDYCVTAAMDSFVVTKSDKHTTDMAMLAGARLVLTTEVDEGQIWAEARLKQLTGRDPITARFMHRDNFTYLPQFKLTISGNHKPRLNNVDEAMKRRLHLAPFLFKPPVPDETLQDRLQAEWPGILRWMIEGCAEWQQFGLNPPKAVQDATGEYFAAQDFFTRWLEERCVCGPGLETKPSALLQDLQEWCRQNGEEMTDNRRLRGLIERTAGLRYVTVQGAQKVRGIGLKPASNARSDYQ